MAKKNGFQLVIVESPTKAKTIGQFLGDDFVVKSSNGHIRDLKNGNSAVDVEHDFMPEYVIPEAKKHVVDELEKLAKKADDVWLASDEDREGESISWHLAEVLGLDVASTKRIAFHEITKNAIMQAISNPRHINMDLVDAQQARRILDRLVGFEISSVLWRKVLGGISAGRVQSVAVRILVDREREIIAFVPRAYFAAQAKFTLTGPNGRNFNLLADLNVHFGTEAETEEFLNKCANATFAISNVESKTLTRQPAPPFTTSTLQQEAGRKLGFPVSLTMSTAQALYEAGLITYMRTDSVNLSELALSSAQKAIGQMFGPDYYQLRRFKTHSKGAQEAHEAIRPTAMENTDAGSTPQEKKLYKLIWNRTVASQMTDAQIERTSITIDTPVAKAHFSTSADVIKFDGFMKLYLESTDDDDDEKAQTTLPKVTIGQPLNLAQIQAREKWSQKPPRYNEASLVKKLEEMGVGRPSTYAPTITTIQQRGYVVKDTREGHKRTYRTLSLAGGTVQKASAVENTGAESNKLFPTDIGMVVNDFLVQHFADIVNYDFTAQVEQTFDEIAEGKMQWQAYLKQFYSPFHNNVVWTTEHAQRCSGERLLGTDPKTGKNVYARIGRFGPMAQIGDQAENDDDQAEKPRFASLRKDQHIETISLDEALQLFELPRNLGLYEDKEVVIGTGRFGPYIRHDGKFVSLRKDNDPYSINLDEAIALIEAKREADRNKLIKSFPENPDLTVLNGRWGPYIAFGKSNVKIPKGTDAASLTFEQCMKLCAEQGADPNKKTTRAKTATTKTTAKTATKTATKASTKTASKTSTKTSAKSATKTDNALTDSDIAIAEPTKPTSATKQKVKSTKQNETTKTKKS